MKWPPEFVDLFNAVVLMALGILAAYALYQVGHALPLR